MYRVVSPVSRLLAPGGSMPAQVEPHVGQWKTWIIASGTVLARAGLGEPPRATARSRFPSRRNYLACGSELSEVARHAA
jgi:hypothetical protein